MGSKSYTRCEWRDGTKSFFEGNAHVAGRVFGYLNPDGSADDTGNRYENSR